MLKSMFSFRLLKKVRMSLDFARDGTPKAGCPPEVGPGVLEVRRSERRGGRGTHPEDGHPSERMGARQMGLFQQPARRPRGAALIIAMLIMAVLLLAGTTFMTISSTESQIVLNETSLVRAFYEAESALIRTVVILSGNSGYTGTSGTGAGGVSYTVQVINPGSHPCPTSDSRIIKSLGSVNVQGALASVDIWATVDRISYPFRFAIFSTVPNTIVTGTRQESELLFGSSVVTDSFDSELGAYDASMGLNNPPTTSCPGGTACGNKAMFGRAGANGDTNFSSGSRIYGDLRAGDAINNGGNVTVSGISVSLLSSSATSPGDPFQSITPPGTASGSLTVTSNTTITPGSRTPSGDLGALTVNAGITLTLEEGTYYATTMSFAGGTAAQPTRLAVTGPVTIYFTGGSTTFGNYVTWGNSSNPTWLKVVLNSTGTNYDSVDVTTGSHFTLYGGLYGKNTNIDIGSDSVIYGSVVGRIVSLQDRTLVHYDHALGMQPVCHTGRYQVRRGTWREVLPSW